jgi:hypothetical protein
MSGKTIYAVSSGDYSDYRVNALFSTREAAESFMATVKDDYYNAIEEYELDPPTVSLIQRGYSVWRVVMRRDGTVENCDRHDPRERYNSDDVPSHRIWERTKAPAYKGRGIPDALMASVWARTEKQAVKIVNEKRAQIIASGEWSA